MVKWSRGTRVEEEAPRGNAAVSVLPPPESMTRLGDLLVSRFVLTPDGLHEALAVQDGSDRKLGSILLERGLLDAGTLTQALAVQVGLPTVDLRRVQPSSDALAVLDGDRARRHQVVPLQLRDGVLDVAVADPRDDETRQLLSALPVEQVRLHLAVESDVLASLDAHYKALADVEEQLRQLPVDEVRVAPTVDTGTDDAPIIQLVNKIVTQALRDRSSDIHIEPTEGRVRVRFRIDGALTEVLTLPEATGPALVSRLKIMADMNIVEKRRPQDGQFHTSVDGRDLDVRVATAPTIWGEKAVLRLLDKSRSLMQMSDLGMPAASYEVYSQIVHLPYGMIICSGPTGSGKTTTLYATLAEISRSELNVMTIEDPVEYVFPSINQMQINVQAEVTFASGLKSILRQDPDVILVGEIRDIETARIAVQSALTGHFVMSSLHATDAASALHRLLDMGVEPFLVASSLVGVVGQRLVRRVCPACRTTYTPSTQELAWYRYLGGPETTDFVRGAGCVYCSHTGFRDRVGVYEVLRVTDEIRQLMVSGAGPQQVRELAVSQGMRTMADEAVALVAEGVTTIDEVIRNVYVS
jgi:type IV pilus assembly protein PilB